MSYKKFISFYKEIYYTLIQRGGGALSSGPPGYAPVQLRTLYAAHSLATLCLSTTSGPDPGELPGLWGSMVFRHAPIPRKGSGNQQQQRSVYR